MSKQHRNSYSLYTFLGCLLCSLFLLTSCPSENPLLVNPPNTKDSILVRFVNVVPNSSPITAILDETVSFDNVSNFKGSSAIASPADSVFFKVIQNGTTVYNSSRRYRFIKNSVQTIYALPRVFTNQPNFDTVLVTTTSNFSPPGAFASIRVLYFTDNIHQFALRAGCPNGPIVTNAFLNQTPSAYQQVFPGEQTISLTKTLQNGLDSTIGTYTVNLNTQKSYTIILTDYSNIGIKPFLLKEFDNSENAFSELISSPVQNVSIRTINVSTSVISMFAGSDNEFENTLQPQFTSSFKQLQACVSTNKDSIFTKIGSNITSTTLLQMIPPRKYTVVVTDSKVGQSDISIPIEPVIPDTIGVGKSRIRVVQANANYPAITVSVGARFNDQFASNFSTGEILARDIAFGGVSIGSTVTSGYLPITVFDNATPANLLATSLMRIDPKKGYVLIFSKDPLSQESKLSLVSEDDELVSLLPLERGSMVQFIHGITGLDSVKLSSGSILSNANFTFTNSIVTVLPFGNNQISFNQNNFAVDITSTKKIQLFTESSNVVRMNSFDFIPGGRINGVLKRRFINASDVPKITITTAPQLVFDLQDNLENAELEHLETQTESPISTTNLNQRLSFFFWARNEGEKSGTLVKSATNLSLPLGKNYSIILVGNNKNGYEVIITQEF